MFIYLVTLLIVYYIVFLRCFFVVLCCLFPCFVVVVLSVKRKLTASTNTNILYTHKSVMLTILWVISPMTCANVKIINWSHQVHRGEMSCCRLTESLRYLIWITVFQCTKWQFRWITFQLPEKAYIKPNHILSDWFKAVLCVISVEVSSVTMVYACNP